MERIGSEIYAVDGFTAMNRKFLAIVAVVDNVPRPLSTHPRRPVGIGLN